MSRRNYRDPDIRELAARLDRFDRDNRNRRQPTLGFSTITGGAIKAADSSGQLRMIVGDQYDGTNTAAVVTGPNPPRPTAPLVTPTTDGLRIYWDGTFAGGGVAPLDFSRVTVHAVPGADWTGTPNPTDQAFIVGEFSSATGGEVTAALGSGVHYVYLFSWSQAGKFSDPSDIAFDSPLPVEVPPPTSPPAESPTPTIKGMPTSLLIEAVGDVEPGTILEYHLSTTDGFTPTADTLAAETASPVFIVHDLPPANGALKFDTTYYVRIVAKNVAGSAAPSAQGQGELDPDALIELALERIVAGFVLAGKIQVGQITIDSDEGITIPSADGIIRFPVDGSVSTITARLIATALTMQGEAVVQDVLRVAGREVLEDAGVSDPKGQPIVTSTWVDVPITGLPIDPVTGETVRLDGPSTLDESGNLLILTGVGGQVPPGNPAPYGAVRINPTTGAYISAVPEKDWSSVGFSTENNIVRVGSFYFSAYWVIPRFSDTATLYLFKRDLSFNLVADYTMGVSVPVPIPQAYRSVGIGTDGTNVLIGWGNSGVRVKSVSTTGSLIADNTYTPPAGWTSHAAIMRGNFLYGAVRTVLVPQIGSSSVFNGTTEQAANRFTAGASIRGCVWDGTRFLSILSGTPTIRRHAATPTARTVSASFSWYDGNSTGGTHETKASPAKSVSIPAGKFVQIEADPAPAAGKPSPGTDDPTLVRIYAGTPTRTLQTTLALGKRVATLDALATGAAEPAANSFVGIPGFSPGYLESAAQSGGSPVWQLRGDGVVKIGTKTWGSDGRSPTPAISAYRTTPLTLAAGTSTLVGVDTVRNSSGGMTLNSGTIIAPKAGWYQVSGSVTFASSTSSTRRIAWIATGTSAGNWGTVHTSASIASAQDTANISILAVSAAVYVEAGNSISIVAQALTSYSLDVSQPYMNAITAVWIGD